jgi:hypothetical protein
MVFSLMFTVVYLEKVSMTDEKTKVVATRVTHRTAELIDEFCRRDGHVNVADFIRDAIREKLQREAPELYRRFFEEA